MDSIERSTCNENHEASYCGVGSAEGNLKKDCVSTSGWKPPIFLARRAKISSSRTDVFLFIPRSH